MLQAVGSKVQFQDRLEGFAFATDFLPFLVAFTKLESASSFFKPFLNVLRSSYYGFGFIISLLILVRVLKLSLNLGFCRADA